MKPVTLSRIISLGAALLISLAPTLTLAGTSLDVDGAFKIQKTINQFINDRLQATRERQQERESESRERWQQIEQRNKEHSEELQQELQQEAAQAHNQQEARNIQQQQLALQYLQIKGQIVAEIGVDYTSYTVSQLNALRHEFSEARAGKPSRSSLLVKTNDPSSGLTYVKYSKSNQEYFGQVTNNKRDGVGTMFFADGSIYSGEWRNGDETEGMYWWRKRGGFYLGTFDKDGQSVKGTYLYANGEIEQGEFATYGGILGLNGAGCKIYTENSGTYSGAVILGHFKNDRANGLIDTTFPGLQSDRWEVIGNFAFGTPTHEHVLIQNGRGVKPNDYNVNGGKTYFSYDFGDHTSDTYWWND